MFFYLNFSCLLFSKYHCVTIIIHRPVESILQPQCSLHRLIVSVRNSGPSRCYGRPPSLLDVQCYLIGPPLRCSARIVRDRDVQPYRARIKTTINPWIRPMSSDILSAGPSTRSTPVHTSETTSVLSDSIYFTFIDVQSSVQNFSNFSMVYLYRAQSLPRERLVEAGRLPQL